MGRLEGKVVIISGSSSGFGLAGARIMGKEGAKIVMFARGEERLMARAKELEAEGIDLIAMKADATKKEDWAMVVEKTLEKYGKIDVLVNNAGQAAPNYPPMATMFTDELDGDGWMDHVDELFISQVLGTKACINEILKTKGNIIFLSSETAIRPSLPISAYGCSKAAIVNFMKGIAAQYGAAGIRANAILPGYIPTELIPFAVDTSLPVVQGWIRETPLGRLGDSDDIGYAMLYLASDEAKYVSGLEMVVDGGMQVAATSI